MEAAYPVLVVVAGVVANSLIAGMFLARVHAPHLARPLGLCGTSMALPLAAASVIAAVGDGDGWAVGLPLVFVVFAVVEVVVDVVLDFDVRQSAWLGPYLGLFYVAQWAVIGAAFGANELGGFAVLASYFVCLFATWYSYRRVGHAVESGTLRS